MTEEEWLSCGDPQLMLDYLGSKASERKLRHFAAACCRRIWPFLPDERSRKAVELGELFADGLAEGAAMELALSEAGRAVYAISRPVRKSRSGRPVPRVLAAAICARLPAWPSQGGTTTSTCVTQILTISGSSGAIYLRQILRELFGNPFCPISIAPSIRAWNDDTIIRLAQAAYEERILPAGTLDNTRLAVLADALEEAGCTDEQILGHLRGGSEHYRGCWVIDLLLGKE